MSKIKFSLVKFERCLVYQIHEQDSSITSGILYINTEMGYYMIRSSGRPEMTDNTLYIRGMNKDDDHIVIVRRFRDNADRDAYYDKVITSFKKWSGGNNI